MKATVHLATIFCVIAALTGCGPEMAMTNTVDTRPEWETEPRPVPIELPRIVPVPAIPVALRGCWDAIPPEDPDEPGGPHRMIVTDRTIELTWEGGSRESASVEYVTRITPTLLEGMLSYPDKHGHRATLATSLGLLEESPSTLRRAEGDAGIVHYTKCSG